MRRCDWQTCPLMAVKTGNATAGPLGSPRMYNTVNHVGLKRVKVVREGLGGGRDGPAAALSNGCPLL